MKKALCVLVALILLLSFPGCEKTPKQNFIKPVNFYYCNREISYNSVSGVFGHEVREAADSGSLNNLLWTYLRGPESDKLVSPFPAGLRVVSLKQSGKTVSIRLSRNFSTLQGIALTRACACLSMTLGNLTGAETIEISTENALLDGREKIIMTPDNLQLIDTEHAESEITEERK